MAFLTARRPSLTASLICVRVCLLGPFTSSVTERGFSHFSMKVYFSSPWSKEKKIFLNLVIVKQLFDKQRAFHWCSPVCVHKPARRVPSTRPWGHQLNSWRCPHRRGWACQEKHVTFKTPFFDGMWRPSPQLLLPNLMQTMKYQNVAVLQSEPGNRGEPLPQGIPLNKKKHDFTPKRNMCTFLSKMFLAGGVNTNQYVCPTSGFIFTTQKPRGEMRSVVKSELNIWSQN